jgi:hypothetical protein
MLNEQQVRLASSAVRELRVALSNFFLYAVGNDMVLKSLERFRVSISALFEDMPSVGIAESEGHLLVEGSPLDERMTGSTNMIKDLFLTHKVQSITFLPGLDNNEIRALFELLKPKALPTGVSLVQVLVQKPLPHIRLNEKIYVAIKEGERVVASDAVPKEENLQEALEALQYFLQIFSRVKPDANKKELAHKLFENMGGWFQGMQGPGGPGEDGGAGNGTGAGPGSGSGGAALLEVLNALNDVRHRLGSSASTDSLGEVRIGMDEVLKKMVFLAEKGGAAGAAEALLAQGSPGKETDDDEEQLTLGVASLLANMQIGRWEFLSDASKEEEVAELTIALQVPSQQEDFEQFWEKAWVLIASSKDETVGLALRHLNRVNWNLVPRHLQLQGIRDLRQFISEKASPFTYPIALTLAQAWMPQEVEHPDWTEFIEMTRVLKTAAETKAPRFEKQDLAARAALETIFCQPILERFLQAHGGAEKDQVVRVLQLLGPLASDLLLTRAFTAPEESVLWLQAVELLQGMESKGTKVFEDWFREHGDPENLGKFLDIFKKVPLPGPLADHLEKNWKKFDLENQRKFLEIGRIWKRSDFRPLLLELLKKADGPLGLKALEVLAEVGLEGDSRQVLEAVRSYPLHGAGREGFWVAACRALGKMADPLSIESLVEWAEKYKLLENKKTRPLVIRKAAIGALGHFRSNVVKNYLFELQKEGEKELREEVEHALRSVNERLARPVP